ncbi:MAG: efflux RND transporter periplasmic adaptor subunit [Anaerolineaceae bacterium]|nr:efflux RND transporter periplasmic adaptor subunit [Anaerolineaceae bacterium]
MTTTKKRSFIARNRIWIILLAVLLVGGGTAAWYFFLRADPTTAAASTETTQTATARRGDLRISASGSGTLIAGKTAELSFSTSGTVDELNVKIGERVTAGQKLASLGNTEKLETGVLAAELNVISAQKVLDSLQASADSAVAQAYQTFISARATQTSAQKNVWTMKYSRCSGDTIEDLYEEMLIKQETVVKLTEAKPDSDDLATAKDLYNNAKANYDYCLAYTEDEKLEAAAALQVAQSSLVEAEKTYETLKTSAGIDPDELTTAENQLKQAEISLALAQQDLAGTVLTSPIDGVVLDISGEAGKVADTGVFITVADLDHPYLDIYIDETDLDKLFLGASVEIVFDAYPDNTLLGTVTEVSPQLYSSGQSSFAQGVVEIDPETIPSGVTLPLNLGASVEVIANEVTNAVLIPVEALRDLGGGEYAVMVVDNLGGMKLRAVTVGIMDYTYVEITSGLESGEKVSTGLMETAQ